MSRTTNTVFPPRRGVAGSAGHGIARFRREPRDEGAFALLWTCVIALLLATLCAELARGAPTAEEVFKSVGQNVNQSSGGGGSPTMALVIGGAGLLLILLLVSLRRKRQVAPRAVNHQGKLLREISKSVSIKPSQMKKLKIVAEEFGQRRGEPLQSPLVLLLCPSVLADAMKKRK